MMGGSSDGRARMLWSQVRALAAQPSRYLMRFNVTKDFLHHQYVVQEKSLGDIAKDIGCSRIAVSKMLKRFSMQARTKSEARQLALGRGKITAHGKRYSQIKSDLDFFKSWSPAMAWVLGLLFTDGCMIPGKRRGARTTSSTDKISLSQKDSELLNQVLKAMKSNATIQATKRGMHSITFSDYYERLLELGMTPRKSLTIGFPHKIPENMQRHFVRGCWDGDGSVYHEYGYDLRASFGSGSEKMILDMADCLAAASIRFNGPYATKTQNPYYSLRLVTKSSLEALAKFMYQDVDVSICLRRKRSLLLGLT